MLIVWKAPLVDDVKDAERVLSASDENGDESAFQANPDVERFYDEIFTLYPPLERRDADLGVLLRALRPDRPDELQLVGARRPAARHRTPFRLTRPRAGDRVCEPWRSRERMPRPRRRGLSA